MEDLIKPHSDPLDNKKSSQAPSALNKIQKFRYLVLTLLLIIMICGLIIVVYRKSSSPLTLLKPSKVMASEIIEKNKSNFFKSGRIYHQKTKQFLENKLVITYEIWEDLDSPRFLNHVTDPDGNETWQWFDLDTSWDLDVKQKTLRKEIYVYDEKNPRGAKLGTRVDLSVKFDQLVNEGVLETKEGILDGREVYVIYDIRTEPDKFWDVLTFDKNTFQLIKTEKLDNDTDPQNTAQTVAYEIQESLDANSENYKSLFETPPISLEDYKVMSRKFDLSGNQQYDYVEGEIPIEKNAKPDSFQAGGLILKIPDNYEVAANAYANPGEKLTLIDIDQDIKIVFGIRQENEDFNPQAYFSAFENECPDCPIVSITQKQNPKNPLRTATRSFDNLYYIFFLSPDKKTVYEFSINDTDLSTINRDLLKETAIKLIEASRFDFTTEIREESEDTTTPPLTTTPPSTPITLTP